MVVFTWITLEWLYLYSGIEGNTVGCKPTEFGGLSEINIDESSLKMKML